MGEYFAQLNGSFEVPQLRVAQLAAQLVAQLGSEPIAQSELSPLPGFLCALAYFTIAIALAAAFAKRKEPASHWILSIVALFFVFGGTAYLLEAWAAWQPTADLTHLRNLINIAAAATSLATAVAAWLLAAGSLTLRSGYGAESEQQLSDEQLRMAHRDLEQEVMQRTQELTATVRELEEFNRMAVGREEQMIELKMEINSLLAELGRRKQYEISL